MKNKIKKALKMRGGGGKNRKNRGGQKGKSSAKSSSKRKMTSTSSATTSKKRRLSATVPQPVLGRIYFGSGVWGGGGGGKDGGNERQVGEERAASNTRVNPSIMRTTCNPKFRSSSDYYPRRMLQGFRSPFSPPSLTPSSPSLANFRQMKGGGIGAVFASIFKTLVPVFKGLFRAGSAAIKTPMGQAIKQETIKSGLNAGINVVGDALRGKNVLASSKNRIKEQAAQLPSNIERAVKKNQPKTVKMNNPPKSINRGRIGSRSSLKRGVFGVPIYPKKTMRPASRSRKNKKDLFN